ncbi:MAG: hypothetical protein C4B58_13275 [Deltaproteobacteria bacterium]|nr:MAG: hypothetical protein C4B58_13275 [Deltaproteobacteria bacterium]
MLNWRSRAPYFYPDFHKEVAATEACFNSPRPWSDEMQAEGSGISISYHPQVRKAAVFVYDGMPGGVGLIR